MRFQATAALVQSGDKSAVPRLIASLSEGPMEFAVPAEDLLFQIAGEATSLLGLQDDTPASRRQSRTAWEGWWQANEAKVDLAKLKLDETPLGITLVSEVGGDQNGLGRVCAYGMDGKPRWAIKEVDQPSDVQFLPGGRVLIAEVGARRIAERDLKGKVYWESKVDNIPIDCQRLPNGNTFVATVLELREVTPAGKTVFSHALTDEVCDARSLPNGHYICYAAKKATILELDSAGKEVRTIPLGAASTSGSIDLLANGHFLLAQSSLNKVVEIDAAGKECWKCDAPHPSCTIRLRNGHTLVACFRDCAAIEYDHNGKEVRKQTTPGFPISARRY